MVRTQAEVGGGGNPVTVRKEIHVAVTGRKCSLQELTNLQLDAVLTKLRAVPNPKNGAY